MTTQLTTLKRIIKELKELNEFDGETVEYLLEQLGYEDYVLRHLMMKESIHEVESHYDERIKYEKDNNNLTYKHPLLHRFDMIKDDVEQINLFIKHHGLDSAFELPTKVADSCYTHLSNIEIACDVNDSEVYKWGTFNQYEENPEAHSLKNEWRNLTNLNVEAKRLCKLLWVESTNYTRKNFLKEHNIITIDLILIVHEFWNDIENDDTIGNFEHYWKFFIDNRNKVLSL